MNRDDLLEFMKTTHTTLIDTTKRKNSDYAGKGGSSPFANFTNVEKLGICSTETGFLTRMTDKMSRITSLVNSGTEGEVKDESITDTLLDLANYSILLMAYLESKKSPTDHITLDNIATGGVAVPFREYELGESVSCTEDPSRDVYRVDEVPNPNPGDFYSVCAIGSDPTLVYNDTVGRFERRVDGFHYGC